MSVDRGTTTPGAGQGMAPIAKTVRGNGECFDTFVLEPPGTLRAAVLEFTSAYLFVLRTIVLLHKCFSCGLDFSYFVAVGVPVGTAVELDRGTGIYR